MSDIAAIVARDAAYDTMNVTLDEAAADGSRGGRMQMAADRRALLVLLRETREALRETANALALTYTNVVGQRRPHWCRLESSHDATCSGMLHIQDMARAALEVTA